MIPLGEFIDTKVVPAMLEMDWAGVAAIAHELGATKRKTQDALNSLLDTGDVSRRKGKRYAEYKYTGNGQVEIRPLYENSRWDGKALDDCFGGFTYGKHNPDARKARRYTDQSAEAREGADD
jgi:hypothetical protein